MSDETSGFGSLSSGSTTSDVSSGSTTSAPSTNVISGGFVSGASGASTKEEERALLTLDSIDARLEKLERQMKQARSLLHSVAGMPLADV